MLSRISTDVKSTSQWQMLYVAGYIALLVSVVMFVVPWWLAFVIAMIAVMACIFGQGRKVQPLHITEPDETNFATRWQLLYAGQQKEELWEAELTNIQDYGQCIQLNFYTTHPVASVEQFVLWQDQIDPKAWRKFKALAKWQA